MMIFFSEMLLRVNPLHTGYIPRLMFKLVYCSLKAVKMDFARLVIFTGQWEGVMSITGWIQGV